MSKQPPPLLPDEALRPGSDPDEAARLLGVLQRGGLTAAAVAEVFGVKESAANTAGWWTFETDEADLALLRLFYTRRPVPRDEVEAALDGFPLSRLEDMGLARVDGDVVEGVMHLQPFKGGVFAADWPLVATTAEPLNQVLPVSMSSAILATLTPRRPVGRTLDVGTGNGVQAILAAGHSDSVVATDVNARALDVARFNCWLNGVSNVELRQGSLYEPVEGEQFDLIVANPPFIIAPEVLVTYAESGMQGHAISEAATVGAGEHLPVGGTAIVMMAWGIQDGESESRRPSAWAAAADCDAVIVISQVESARAYAYRWARPDEIDVRPDRWVEHYRSLGYRKIATGAMRLEKRSPDDAELVRVGSYRFPFRMGPEEGWEALERLSHVTKVMGRIDTSNLPALVVRPEGYHLMQRFSTEDGSEPILQEATATLSLGLALSMQLDMGGYELLRRADGKRSVAEIVADAAQSVGVPEDELLDQACRAALAMVGMGILIPVL